jgi:hypothetical protein
MRRIRTDLIRMNPSHPCKSVVDPGVSVYVHVDTPGEKIVIEDFAESGIQFVIVVNAGWNSGRNEGNRCARLVRFSAEQN